MVIKKNERKLAKQIKNLANQNIQIDISSGNRGRFNQYFN